MLQAMTDIYIAFAVSLAVVALLLAKFFYARWTEAEENALLIQKDRDLWKRKAESLKYYAKELAREKELLIDKLYEKKVSL